jgi:hypothetical protein
MAKALAKTTKVTPTVRGHLCCDTRMLVVGLFLQHACRIVNTLFCLEYHYDHYDHCDHYDHYDYYDHCDHCDHYDQF